MGQAQIRAEKVPKAESEKLGRNMKRHLEFSREQEENQIHVMRRHESDIWSEDHQAAEAINKDHSYPVQLISITYMNIIHVQRVCPSCAVFIFRNY